MCNGTSQSDSNSATHIAGLASRRNANEMTTNANENKQRERDFNSNANEKHVQIQRVNCCIRRIGLGCLASQLIGYLLISSCFYVTYNLNRELREAQAQLALLNQRLVSLGEKWEVLMDDAGEADHEQLRQDENDLYDMDMEAGSTEPSSVGIQLDMGTKEGSLASGRLRRAYSRLHASARHIKSSGSLAAHFKGSKPEATIDEQGLIGPWYHDQTVSRSYKFPKFHLTEGKCSIEVTEQALYFIYAQIYYVTSSAVSSYSLYVRSEGSSQNNVIAKCSTSGPNNSQHMAEISCFTAAVYHLRAHDRIFIRQTERNRTIVLRDGHSFFGIVRLNNERRGTR